MTARNGDLGDGAAPRVVLVGANAVPIGWVSDTVAALGSHDVHLVTSDPEAVDDACVDRAAGAVVILTEHVPAAVAGSIGRALRRRGRGVDVISVAQRM